MNTASVLKALESKGRPNTVNIYRRHGVLGPCWGVPYADLGKFVKQLGTNHEVAQGLWASGVHDARVVATKVADPSRMTVAEIESWLATADNYVMVDAVSGLAARMPGARDLAVRWMADAGEWLAAAGWNVLALHAHGLNGATLDEADGLAALARIRDSIHQQPNRVRHAMNNALISMGGSMPALRKEALAVARAIGRVDVDHGDTGCKTPDAVPYIEKMVAHSAARTRVTGAAMKAVPQRAATRKTAGKKTVARKAGGKKSAKKKATTRKAARKAPAKKQAAARKAAAKRKPARKKAASRRAAARSKAPRKAAARRR